MNINQRNRHRRRQGAAVVEFAVCLPLILLVAFGAVEAAGMLFLRQTLVQAAYEGAKVIVRNEGTEDQSRAIMDAVIAGRRLQGVSIQFNPANPEAVELGVPITVTVSAPSDSNSLISFGFFRDRDISASAVFAKE